MTTRPPGSVAGIKVLLWVQLVLFLLGLAGVAWLITFMAMLGVADTGSSTSGSFLLKVAAAVLVGALVAVLCPIAVLVIAGKRLPWARWVIVVWEALMILAAVGYGATVVVDARSAASGWSIATTSLGTQPPPIDVTTMLWPSFWLIVAATTMVLAIGPSASRYYSGEAATTPPG